MKSLFEFEISNLGFSGEYSSAAYIVLLVTKFHDSSSTLLWGANNPAPVIGLWFIRILLVLVTSHFVLDKQFVIVRDLL